LCYNSILFGINLDTNMSVTSLPEEILYSIFKFLDVKSLLQCSTACSHWNKIIDSEIAKTDLWFYLFKHHMAESTSSHEKNEPFLKEIDADNTNMNGSHWQDELKKYLQMRTKTRVIQTIKLHSDEVWHAAWNHAGNKLATAGKDGMVHFFNLKQYKNEYELEHFRSYESTNGHSMGYITWSPDDTRVLLSQSGFNNTAPTECVLYDLETEATVEFRSRPYDVFGTWIDNNKITVGAGFTYTHDHLIQHVEIADLDHLTVESKGCLLLQYPLDNHNFAHCLCTARNGTIACYATGDNYHITNMVQVVRNLDQVKLQRIDASTLESIHLKGNSQGVCIADDGKLFANVRPLQDINADLSEEEPAMLDKFELHMYDTDDLAQPPKIFLSHVSYSVFLAYPHVIGDIVASGSEDGRIVMWHKKYGYQIGEWREHGAHVSFVALNHVHRELFASVSDDMTIKLWINS
jgi:WD40 repeat protein